MRTFFNILLLLSLASVAQSAERPNIVLILVDDLGACDLGYTGSTLHETPNIDSLAARGTVFTQGYAACHVCSPTRAAVQTGKAPVRLGITDWIHARWQNGVEPVPVNGQWPYTPGNGKQLACPANRTLMDTEEVTLAERLKTLGYHTGYIGKWHLGPPANFPDRQGFDVNVGGCDLGHQPSSFDPYYPTSTETNPGNPSDRPLYRISTLPPERPGEHLCDRGAREAVKFLREAHEDGRPFFLQLATYAVHVPIMSKKAVRQKYQEKLNAMRARNQDPNQEKIKITHKDPNYAALIESLDTEVGVVLQTLEELGVAKNTIVIFTSDNGGFLGATNNLPLREGKGSPFEGGVRVPLVVYYPGLATNGKTCDTPFTSYDFVPTLMDFVGAPLSAEEMQAQSLDGTDVMPVLRGDVSSLPRTLYWHFPHYRNQWAPHSIIRDGDWKLIRWYTPDGHQFDLFNLREDPYEQRDLSSEQAELVQRLDAQLGAWLEQTGARLPR